MIFEPVVNTSFGSRTSTVATRVSLEDDVIRAAKEVRDGAAHPSENIVADHKPCGKLATLKRECLRILSSH